MPRCEENEVTEAKSGDKIDFGWVDSCMTVTVNLLDGTRVAGHFVQYGLKDSVFTNMLKLIGKRSIKSIRLVGQLRSWTPDLEEQPEIVARATKDWSKGDKEKLQKMTMYEVDQKYGKYFDQFSIAGKPDDFKKFISQKFSCSPSNMSLRSHETGVLSL